MGDRKYNLFVVAMACPMHARYLMRFVARTKPARMVPPRVAKVKFGFQPNRVSFGDCPMDFA